MVVCQTKKEVLAAMAVDPLEIGCALLAEFNVA
jgi:hypothetical protein